MEYTYAIETAHRAKDELLALGKKHHDELVGENIEYNPIVSRYFTLEKTGHLAVFTVRCEGELVGYAFFFISRDIHREQILRADNDIIFIDPEHRKGWNSYHFIKFIVQKLQEYNITDIYIGSTMKKQFGVLLKRCGFQQSEILFSIKRKNI